MKSNDDDVEKSRDGGNEPSVAGDGTLGWGEFWEDERKDRER